MDNVSGSFRNHVAKLGVMTTSTVFHSWPRGDRNARCSWTVRDDVWLPADAAYSGVILSQVLRRFHRLVRIVEFANLQTSCYNAVLFDLLI